MGKEYLGRGPCSSLSRGMRRVSLLPLDLGRGYDAPFLVRPDRLPLGKATVCKGHRKPNREGFAVCRVKCAGAKNLGSDREHEWFRVPSTPFCAKSEPFICRGREHRDSPFLVTNISTLHFDQK